MKENLPHPENKTTSRLLIVDDEPNIRTSLARALSLLGYDAEEANSGDEALTLLARTPYDLMVLDMQMPGIDGVEVMHYAHQLQPDLLIIVLTGHATLENAIAAVKLDAVDYLRKPISIEKIAGTVSKALQKHARQIHEKHLVHTMVQTLDALSQVDKQVPPPHESKETADRFLRVPPLTLDCLKQIVTIDDIPLATIALTEGETAILVSLMTHPNQVISCRELTHMAWHQEISEVEAQNIVRPHISRLRRKIETLLKKPRLIRTVRKRGYYLATPES